MFLDAEPTWERSYLDAWTVLDTLDRAALVQAARQLSARNHVDGVLSWDEMRIEGAAQVAQVLGLPGGAVEAVATCRDKHRTRVALDARAGPQPRSVPIVGVHDAVPADKDVRVVQRPSPISKD